MSLKVVCDSCNKVALNGVERGWIVLSGWSGEITDPYLSVGVVVEKDEYELIPYDGLHFCSHPCLSAFFIELYGNALNKKTKKEINK